MTLMENVVQRNTTEEITENLVAPTVGKSLVSADLKNEAKQAPWNSQTVYSEHLQACAR